MLFDLVVMVADRIDVRIEAAGMLFGMFDGAERFILVLWRL